MRGGTKGGDLAARLDAQVLPVDPTWGVEDRHGDRVLSWGTRRPVTAKDIERMGEVEYERRTSGGWSDDTCPGCQLRKAYNGTCDCNDTPTVPGERVDISPVVAGWSPPPMPDGLIAHLQRVARDNGWDEPTVWRG